MGSKFRSEKGEYPMVYWWSTMVYYGFNMGLLWVYYGFTMVSIWFDNGFTMGLIWFDYRFTMVSIWFYKDNTGIISGCWWIRYGRW